MDGDVGGQGREASEGRGRLQGPRICLVWDTSAIGDVLQRIGAITAVLRAIFPYACLDLLTRRIAGRLMNLVPGIARVHALEDTLVLQEGQITGFTGDFPAQHYDVLFYAGSGQDYERPTLNALLALEHLVNPACIVDFGWVRPSQGNLFRAVLDSAVTRWKLVNGVNRVDFILRSTGLPTGYRATLRPDAAFACPEPPADRPVIFLHTRSNAAGRCYRHGAQLAAALEEAGYFVWNAEAKDHDLCQVAWMIQQSDYVVTVDTSLLHVANALGKRSLCLVGQMMAPWVGTDDFCFVGLNCAWCISRKTYRSEDIPCERKFACMDVDPAEVVAWVDAYFDIQALRPTALAHRYLAVRQYQNDLAMELVSGGSQPAFDLVRLSLLPALASTPFSPRSASAPARAVAQLV